jgi:hypothetical protein
MSLFDPFSNLSLDLAITSAEILADLSYPEDPGRGTGRGR